jgi:enoyl-CoA hydratase
MSDQHLTFERDGNVVILTMNNPRRKNALTPEMITLMAQAWDEIDSDDSIRAAILTGSGDSYCVGGDLADGWMVKSTRPASEDNARQTPSKRHGSIITDGLLLTRSLATPLIAAVNGPSAEPCTCPSYRRAIFDTKTWKSSNALYVETAFN